MTTASMGRETRTSGRNGREAKEVAKEGRKSEVILTPLLKAYLLAPSGELYSASLHQLRRKALHKLWP